MLNFELDLLWTKDSKLTISRGFISKRQHSLPACLSPLRTPDTAHQKERYHQGRGNKLMMPLVSQEAVGTPSIRTRERWGGLLKFSSREAAGVV